MKLRKLTHAPSLSASAERNPPKQKGVLRTHPQVHTSGLLRRRMKLRFTVKLISSFVLLIAIDQFSKYLTRFRHPADGGLYICNKNVAFGIELEPFIFWAILALMFFSTFYILLNPNVKISITKKIPSAKSKVFIFFLWDFIRNLPRRLASLPASPSQGGRSGQAGWDLPARRSLGAGGEIGNFKSPLIAAVLIISGAMSNIIDRLYFGCVIDFIDLKFWPVFNLADFYITLGAILLLAKYLKSYYNNR